MNLVTKDSGERFLASERAYNYIRDAIYGGLFKPGQIVTEEEVAEVVGVSRTPVREALRRASADGFLELEGFRRARVTTFTDEDTKDIFEIRAVLESLAAERAATRISAEEIEQMETLTDALEEATRAGGTSIFRQFAEFNNGFHTVLLKASRSRQIQQALEHLIEIPLILHKRFEGTLTGNLERTIRHHRAIITALKARDPKWAHAEMMVHLMSARSSLV
jgi:DNA-binding GntR family transcriptional regulator